MLKGKKQNYYFPNAKQSFQNVYLGFIKLPKSKNVSHTHHSKTDVIYSVGLRVAHFRYVMSYTIMTNLKYRRIFRDFFLKNKFLC